MKLWGYLLLSELNSGESQWHLIFPWHLSLPITMFHVTLYLVLPLMDALLAAEVRRLPAVERLDCVKASEQCLKEPECSAKYRTLRQCVAGKESNFSKVIGLEAKDECKNAAEALKQKSLYNCRCKRGMKKEKNCLRIYWSMYQSLQGNELLEESPYEPVNNRISDIFKLDSLLSGSKRSTPVTSVNGAHSNKGPPPKDIVG